MGLRDQVSRVQGSPQFTCNTFAIAHLKPWGLLGEFNWYQVETIHLAQRTHFADGKTEALRGEGVCVSATTALDDS